MESFEVDCCPRMSGQKRQSIVTSGNGVDYIVIRGRLR